MATVNDLYDVAVAFLDAATAALALTDEGTPGRLYVGDGEPAMDCCGQLVVWNQTIDQAALNAGPGALAPMHAINRGQKITTLLYVQATRCAKYTPLAPDSKTLPDPALIQATGKMVDQDGWALRLHMAQELRNGGSLAQVCSGAEMLGGQKLTPQGLCVGWTFQFRIPIEGGTLS